MLIGFLRCFSRTHSSEGAVARQSVGVQWFWTVLTGWEQLVQNTTEVRIVTAPQVLDAGDRHPDSQNLLVQSHVHLKRSRTERVRF